MTLVAGGLEGRGLGLAPGVWLSSLSPTESEFEVPEVSEREGRAFRPAVARLQAGAGL
jgi:hypothetical protein